MSFLDRFTPHVDLNVKRDMNCRAQDNLTFLAAIPVNIATGTHIPGMSTMSAIVIKLTHHRLRRRPGRISGSVFMQVMSGVDRDWDPANSRTRPNCWGL